MKSQISFFKKKRKIIIFLGIVVVALTVFRCLTPKNPFLEHSENVQTGVKFGYSNNPIYAGESSETKTYSSLVTFDKAIGASQEQYIDFLQQRVQGKLCDWYILYLTDRDTCIVYYNGDAHTGYYCKSHDIFTISNANLTRENPNLYGIVTWTNDAIQYESIH